MKAQSSQQPQKVTQTSRGDAFKKYSYWLAWINFIAIVGMAVFNTLKEHKPPEKDEYYK